MKDKHDSSTLDAFGTARQRGRPIIRTKEEKREQSAERSRRYRLRQRVINLVARKIATSPDINRSAYFAFLNYMGDESSDQKCEICFQLESGALAFESTTFSSLLERYTTLIDVAIVSCELPR